MAFREQPTDDPEHQLRLLEAVRRLPERPGYDEAMATQVRRPRVLALWHASVALVLALGAVSAWHHFHVLVLRIIVAGALALFALASGVIAAFIVAFEKPKQRFPAAVVRIVDDANDAAISTVWLVTGDGGAVAVAAKRFADDLPRVGDSGVAVVTRDAKLERFHKL